MKATQSIGHDTPAFTPDATDCLLRKRQAEPPEVTASPQPERHPNSPHHNKTGLADNDYIASIVRTTSLALPASKLEISH
jgi:hypothetical protein